MKEQKNEKGLTDHQREVLKFIVGFNGKSGFQPSMREIAEHFNVSVSSVRSLLLLIERKGIIELTGQSRGIRILKKI